MTPKQRAVFDFVAKFWKENRYGPTYAEIGKALNIGGKNGPHHAIKVMQERGWLVRDGACSHRTLRPAEFCPCCGRHFGIKP